MRWRWLLLAGSVAGSSLASVAAPVAAECSGQPNRFPPFLQLAPTAELVVIGTVVEPLRGHDGQLATFRLRVDEVLRGEAPETIDVLGLRSGLPLTGDPGCRENAFAYAEVGDVIALALEGERGSRTTVNSYAFIEGRPSRGLVKADVVTAEDVRAALAPEVTSSPEPSSGPVPSSSPGPSASPIPGLPAGRAASDAFWQHLLQGGDREGIGPRLSDAVDAADLIVLGRPVAVRPWDPDPSDPEGLSTEHLLRIAVDDVIKGRPVTDEPGFIDVLVDNLVFITPDEVNALMPEGERSLFILRNLGKQNAFYDQSQAEIDATKDVYVRILDHLSVIRDLDGLAYGIEPMPLDEFFPGEYEGGPFSTLVDAVRREARRQDR